MLRSPVSEININMLRVSESSLQKEIVVVRLRTDSQRQTICSGSITTHLHQLRAYPLISTGGLYIDVG